MHAPFLSSCLEALTLSPDGVPGMLVPTTLERFELLQTPGLWGQDPTDNSYWLDASGEPTVTPSASHRFLEAIESLVAGADSLLDIASLEPFASGAFLRAIRRGLAAGARAGRSPTVRVLYGRFGVDRPGFPLQSLADFESFVMQLAGDLPADSHTRIHAAAMRSSATPPQLSWNHSKIVAADGQRAIVGGHNLWHQDTLSFAPVHDVSAVVEGAAAGEAHRFLDQLWSWVAAHREQTPERLCAHSICWQQGQVTHAPPPPAVVLPIVERGGLVPCLAMGRLGMGLMEDPLAANIAAEIAAVAFRQATSRIVIVQMDLAVCYQGQNYWSESVMEALADVLTAADRQVEVSLVLSEVGAVGPMGGRYAFGTQFSEIVSELRRRMGDRPVTGRMHIAPLRISEKATRWVHEDRELLIANHGKPWMVDDRVLYVGSDNLYPHSLQEFGYLVESPEIVQQFVRDYWEPLWKFSSRDAIEV